MPRPSGNFQQGGCNIQPHPDSHQQQHWINGIAVGSHFRADCGYFNSPGNGHTITNTCAGLRQLPCNPAGNRSPFHA